MCGSESQVLTRARLPAGSPLPTQVEDLHDENSVLRKRAGLGATDAVDLQGVRMQKQASIAQLRSLNALLERQVRDGGKGKQGMHAGILDEWVHRRQCACVLEHAHQSILAWQEA